MPSFKFPFPNFSTGGERAQESLLQMRAELQSQGQVPVIIGDNESAARLVEAWSYNNNFSFDEALGAATTTQPQEWFQERIDEDPEAFASLLEEKVYPKAAAPMTRLQVGFDYNGEALKEVLIAQLPTSDYWAIPLHLRFGGWNACPESSVHAMLARYWEQRYGARLAVLTSDTIEFTVERPPVSPEECGTLAREQYIYCCDIVEQGVGSVPTLAKALEGSTTWFFWWD